MPNPANPMPPFVGSFISVNGAPLSEHIAFARQAGIVIQKVAEDDLDAAMVAWMDRAKILVPVLTGYLRSTIFITKVGRFEWRFGAFADYAGFVEYGTGLRPAKPYIQPGIIILRETLPGVLIADMSNAMMGA